MLLFLLDRHAPPIAAVLALRILVRLLQSQGSAYVARFTNSTDGFVVLRGAVPHLWNYSQIHVALFALLHDHDISALSLCASFHPSTFLASAVNSSVAAPDVVRVIIACLGRGVKVVNSSGVGLKDGKETSGEAEEEEGETGTPATSPSLEQGFEIILELLSQANRATGLDNSLVASPVLLADLIAAVRPALRLPTTPEYPVTAEVPPLPLLSSRNGYRTAPRDVTIAEQSPEFDSLKLQIPSTPIEQPTSPLTAFEEHEDTTRTPQERNTITPTAASLVGFLGGLLTSLLTSRRSLVGDDSSHTDLSMQLLRDVLDAAACTDVQSQVSQLSAVVSHARAEVTFSRPFAGDLPHRAGSRRRAPSVSR